MSGWVHQNPCLVPSRSVHGRTTLGQVCLLTGKASQDVCSFSSICPSCTTRSKLARCVPTIGFRNFSTRPWAQAAQIEGRHLLERRSAAHSAAADATKGASEQKSTLWYSQMQFSRNPSACERNFKRIIVAIAKVGTLAIGSGKHHRCLQCAPNELIDQLAVAPLPPQLFGDLHSRGTRKQTPHFLMCCFWWREVVRLRA
jgi:hypothetical protein